MVDRAGFGCALFALGGALLLGCAIDDRTLSTQSLDCVEGYCSNGGSAASSGGSSSNGGADASAGDSDESRGGHDAQGGTSSAGGAANAGATYGGNMNSTAGSANVNCPDLDKNTKPDCSETLAKNGTFNTNGEGWDPEVNATAAWDVLNYPAGEKSGSLLVTSSAPAAVLSGDAFVYTGVTQCVPLTPSSDDHVIYANVFSDGVGDNGAAAGYGSVQGRLFKSADCSGTPLAAIPGPNLGTTRLWLATNVTVPGNEAANSLMVELRVGKMTNNSDSVQLRFDNVLVR